jgi:hypothetical protein
MRTWIVDLMDTRYEERVVAENIEFVNGALIFKTGGRILKAFGPSAWRTVEPKGQ